MKLHRIVLAVLTIALLSCSKAPEPQAPSPAPAAAAASAPTSAAAQSSTPAAQASTPAQSSASESTPGEPAGEPTPLLSATLQEGRDYIEIPNGAPMHPAPGKVEVIEFFNYACPACNSFEPKMAAWKKSLPEYVKVSYESLDFRPDFVPYARAYYAAAKLGLVDKTHEAVYDAIHQLHTLPGEGSPADADVIAKFYGNYGVDPARFKELMNSFGVNAQIAAARQFAARSKVTGTPALLIDGKYLAKGDSMDLMLQNASWLITKAHGS